MKVALVQPNSRTYRSSASPPLGLMQVGAFVRAAGHEVRIFDRNIDFFSLRRIKDFQPDLVGVSSFTGPMILDGVRVSRCVKQMFGPDFPVVWGGIHPSLMPVQTLENPYIDCVVRGEGEVTFLDLLDTLERGGNLGQVAGIGYKGNGKIKLTPERPFIADLDSLPMLPWDLVRVDEYFSRDITLVTSRGCPYNCSFCYNQEFNKRRWRAMSAERVLQEIEVVERLTDNKRLKFNDDCFTANKDRFFAIVDGLSSKWDLYFEARVEAIDREFLDHLKRFHSAWIFMGVESHLPRLLEICNKHIEPEQIERAFQLCNEYDNISTTASVILGLPTQTEQELAETVEFTKKLKPTRYTFCKLTLYPGSTFYKESVTSGAFTPPARLEDWAVYTPDISEVNLSEISNAYMNRLWRWSMIQSAFNFLREGKIRLFYQKLRDYNAYLMKYADVLDEVTLGLRLGR